MGFEEFAAATLVVAVGSVVQAISGVGAGFLIVPLLAWIDVSLIPGPVVLGSMSLSGTMGYRERRHIDFAHMPMVFLGMIPGAVAGAYLLSRVSFDELGMMFGAVMLIAIIITASGFRFPLTGGSACLAGAVAGVMGTSSGIGAPVLALLYQDQSGPRVRATLAVLYAGASFLIIIMLFGFGKFGIVEAVSGLLLMPGYMLGYALSHRLTARIDTGGTRAAVLLVSAAAALSLILRGLPGF
ncbi:MAG: TSUP family transporter [Lysobacterales bacterium]|jgi:uncharacterized membrane protein YfcA